jgi:hypothetical protein
MRIVFKCRCATKFISDDSNVLLIQPQKMNIGTGKNTCIIWVSSRGVCSEGKSNALAPPWYFDI